jgi:hypothetical protein
MLFQCKKTTVGKGGGERVEERGERVEESGGGIEG